MQFVVFMADSVTNAQIRRPRSGKKNLGNSQNQGWSNFGQISKIYSEFQELYKFKKSEVRYNRSNLSDSRFKIKNLDKNRKYNRFLIRRLTTSQELSHENMTSVLTPWLWLKNILWKIKISL